MEKLYYGTAYHIETLPQGRLEKDVEMMVRAGINAVCVCGSAWALLEPRDGEFDFSLLDRVLSAMQEAGIGVIVQLPVCPVPAWLIRKHPSALIGSEGAKANILDKVYLACNERFSRALTEHVKEYPAVIGYAVGNNSALCAAGEEQARRRFAAHLKEKYRSLQAVNAAFCRNFADWEEFCGPWTEERDSLCFAYDVFRRSLVAEFFARQASLVRACRRDGQFVACEAAGQGLGLAGNENFLQCADLIGASVFHPSQDGLTGAEIAFAGDFARCLKGGNYYVLETQAQGFPEETPYDGQLRLQAFSHLASGADMVMYSSWHSAHTCAQSRRKGLLSYDLCENQAYREAASVGRSFRQLQARLAHLSKKNSAALLLSDLSSAVPEIGYAEAVRLFYDALYENNFECDIALPSSDLSQYKVIFAPSLYCVGEPLIAKLRNFVAEGGTLVCSCRSFFADENGKVFSDVQPHGMTDVFGMTYDAIAAAKGVSLADAQGICARAEGYMECLRPQGGAQILGYVHENWRQYAAATVNFYGKGKAYYFGCLFEKAVLTEFLQAILREEGVFPTAEEKFPLIVRSGTGRLGKKLFYVFNYSSSARTVTLPAGKYTDLLSGRQGTGTFGLEKWGVAILEKS